MLKSYVWLRTTDGSIQQAEQDVAMDCPFICREVVQNGTGSSKTHAVPLPEKVNTAMLSLILDYCRFHQVRGHSDKEIKSFDENFIRMDIQRLVELATAAESLLLKPLLDLASGALVRVIDGKSNEEKREIFHLPDDLTEIQEEKLELLKNLTDNPQTRLLNRLYARKRKELEEKEKLKVTIANTENGEQNDVRSVDDLLSFINGGVEDLKDIKSSKNKKKNRRRKDKQKITSLREANDNHEEPKTLNFGCPRDEDNTFMPSPSPSSNLTGTLQDTRHDSLQDKGHESLQDTGHDGLQDRGHDGLKDRAHDGLQDTGHESLHDKAHDGLQDTGHESLHDKGHESLQDTGHDGLQDRGQDCLQDRGRDSLQNTGRDCLQDTGHDSVQDTGLDSVQDTGHDGLTDQHEFNDGDIDDDIDPVLMAQIDREVEDFARRLNFDWRQSIQERRRPQLFGNDSFSKFSRSNPEEK